MCHSSPTTAVDTVTKIPIKAPSPPIRILAVQIIITAKEVGIKPKNIAATLIRIDRVSKKTPGISLTGVSIKKIPIAAITIPISTFFHTAFFSYLTKNAL